MGDEAAEYYDRMLVDADWGEAFCLTFVRGLDDATLITAFGGDPAKRMPQAELAQILDGFAHGDEPATLVIGGVGDWRVGIEINGYQGCRPEVLRRAAAAGDGTALSVLRTVTGRSEFTYVSEDRTQVVIDQLRPERRTGPNPELLDALLSGLPFGHEDDIIPEAAGLALAERITGVRLPLDLMEQDLPGVILTLVPDDLVPEAGRGLAALEHPFVRRMLSAPIPENVPAMVAFRTRLIAEDAGLADDPVIQAVLAALDTDDPPSPDLRTGLQELHLRLPATAQALNAVQDIAAAAFTRDTEDPARRFGTAYAIRDSDHSLQAVVLRRCALHALRYLPPKKSASPAAGSVRLSATTSPAYAAVAKQFAAWDPAKQRTVTRWLARRAFEVAGLAELDWARPALEALERGDPLPFPDRRAVFRLISAAALVTAATGLPLDQLENRLTEAQRAELRERIDRAPMAVITIFNTTNPDPARALADTFLTALETFEGRPEDLVSELRDRFC